MYEYLFGLKDLILKIEKKSWYAPWVKPLIKHQLSNMLNFNNVSF